MDLFESSKIPLIVLWLLLIGINVLILATSLTSYFMLVSRIQNVSSYQTVFFQNPSNFILKNTHEAISYGTNSFPNDCPSSFSAPLGFMSMNLLHFMNLKGLYYYNDDGDTYLNGKDYEFDCQHYIELINNYCITGEGKDLIQCKEYQRTNKSSIGPIMQYMLCGSSSECINPKTLTLKYKSSKLSPQSITVTGMKGMNATLLISEAKRYMTTYNQPILLTIDDFVDRTIIPLDSRKNCANTIPCSTNLFKECCYQDSPIRTFDGFYHASNILYSNGTLRSLVVVGWDDYYTSPRSTSTGALFVRDEGASTGTHLSYFEDKTSNTDNPRTTLQEFSSCGNNHAFSSWNHDTELFMNCDNYLKYFSEFPSEMTLETCADYYFTLKSSTIRDNQGLMDVRFDVYLVGVDTSIDTLKLSYVTDAIVELLFYHEHDESESYDCGFYAIDYNVLQQYFSYHHDTGTNPVGFSFMHLKWPSSSKDLQRES
ncbi:Uncharacterized protein QTN25_010313 [Entamoeba marina]